MSDRKAGIYIIFDGPPADISGRFVEVENQNSHSLSPTESGADWHLEASGYWVLGPFDKFDAEAGTGYSQQTMDSMVKEREELQTDLEAARAEIAALRTGTTKLNECREQAEADLEAARAKSERLKQCLDAEQQRGDEWKKLADKRYNEAYFFRTALARVVEAGELLVYAALSRDCAHFSGCRSGGIPSNCSGCDDMTAVSAWDAAVKDAAEVGK